MNLFQRLSYTSLNFSTSAAGMPIFIFVLPFYADDLGLDPYVVESSPAGVFDRAAIKAVRKFLYQPPTYNGTSVKVNNVQIDLTFKLAD